MRRLLIIAVLLLMLLPVAQVSHAQDEPILCKSVRLSFDALTPAQLYDHFGQRFGDNTVYYYDVRVPNGVAVNLRMEWYPNGRDDWETFPEGNANAVTQHGVTGTTYVRGAYLDPNGAVRGIVVRPVNVEHPAQFEALLVACPEGGDPNAFYNDANGDGRQNGDDNCTVNFSPALPSIFVSGEALDCAYQGAHYDSFEGVKGFPQNDGSLHIYGNCVDDNCGFIGRVVPTQLTAGEGVRYSESGSGDWRIAVYYLGPAPDGSQAYQVNTSNAAGVVVDDRLILTVSGDGYRFERRG